MKDEWVAHDRMGRGANEAEFADLEQLVALGASGGEIVASAGKAVFHRGGEVTTIHDWIVPPAAWRMPSTSSLFQSQAEPTFSLRSGTLEGSGYERRALGFAAEAAGTLDDMFLISRPVNFRCSRLSFHRNDLIAFFRLEDAPIKSVAQGDTPEKTVGEFPRSKAGRRPGTFAYPSDEGMVSEIIEHLDRSSDKGNGRLTRAIKARLADIEPRNADSDEAKVKRLRSRVKRVRPDLMN
jgi:hypothetical protein